MTVPKPDAAQVQARNRYIVMNIARIGGLALLLIGVAITRKVAHLSPEWIFGAVLAVAGLLEFFFLPPIIAKRWKAADAGAERQDA